MSKKTATAPHVVKHDQLLELYFYLDSVEPKGNFFLAWYGQNRAKEMSHEAALLETIDHFHLEERDWFKSRLSRFEITDISDYRRVSPRVRHLDEIREVTA